MARKRPDAPTTPVPSTATRKDTETIRVELRVITPVQGGGVTWEDTDQKRHLKPIDEVTPVRVSSIRGQLRFFWRATHGCTSETIEKMREREAELWGSASTASKVEVVVRPAGPPPKTTRSTVWESARSANGAAYNARSGHGQNDIAYGAIGVQPKNSQPTQLADGFITQVEGTFNLDLHYPAHLRQEVLDALRAWLLFGGIGGRTRRGFGAVEGRGKGLWEPDDGDNGDAERFLERLKSSGSKASMSGVPSLRGANLVIANRPAQEAPVAWKDALSRLKDFRQSGGYGRNPGNQPNRPGRSRWPEPDMIRRLLGQAHPNHRPEHRVEAFPRAHFGLPLIFHFKDRQDPGDTTLQPAGKERMASPLILRPTRIGDKYRPLAVRLQVPGRFPAVELKGPGNRTREVSTTLSPQESQTPPLHGLMGQHTDPLEAFLDFFKNAPAGNAAAAGNQQNAPGNNRPNAQGQRNRR